MATLSKTKITTLIAAAMLATSAHAQQTDAPQETAPIPQTPQPVEPTNGALLGGELTPEVAAGAVVTLGVLIAISGGNNGVSTTTTTTGP